MDTRCSLCCSRWCSVWQQNDKKRKNRTACGCLLHTSRCLCATATLSSASRARHANAESGHCTLQAILFLQLSHEMHGAFSETDDSRDTSRTWRRFRKGCLPIYMPRLAGTSDACRVIVASCCAPSFFHIRVQVSFTPTSGVLFPRSSALPAEASKSAASLVRGSWWLYAAQTQRPFCFEQRERQWLLT